MIEAKTNRGSEDGFSVLEAIVAIAILAAAFLPLLALQGQFVQSVRAVERADIRITARQNAVAYLKNLTMTRFPSGEADLGDVRMQWVAVPVEPTQSTWVGELEEGRYNVTLYRLTVTLNDGKEYQDQFEFKSLGWVSKWDPL